MHVFMYRNIDIDIDIYTHTHIYEKTFLWSELPLQFIIISVQVIKAA